VDEYLDDDGGDDGGDDDDGWWGMINGKTGRRTLYPAFVQPDKPKRSRKAEFQQQKEQLPGMEGY
jgi:hypothetical protein